MNFRLLQWIALGALAAAIGVLFLSNRNIAGGLAAARSENQELRTAKSVLQQSAAARAQLDDQELARLRKETEDLQRVQEDARQLRQEKQLLSQQVEQARARAQEANGQVQAAQAQIRALQASAARAAQRPPQAQPGAGAGTASPDGTPASPRMDPAAATSACIRNLQRIAAAKQQWAMENLNPSTTTPAMADLVPYLQNNLPACPAGGTYTPNAVAVPPVCSQPGHVLPP